MEAPKHMMEDGFTGRNTPHEVELKLELASDHAADLLNHPLLARARALPEQSGVLFAVYYDTADQVLRRSGLTLRIRRRDGHHVQTIKAEGRGRSLALDRAEWEWDVENGIDFAAAAETPLAPFIVDEKSRELIQPVFTIETVRHALLVEHEGALIELALDRAVAIAGSQNDCFAEIELELKEGPTSSLFDLAGKLADAAPLRLSPTTKSDRGYALIGPIAPEPATTEDIALPPHAPCAGAFQVIARSCLLQIVRNEALFRRTMDPAALHQMRVGFRRLKAALSLFRTMLDDGETRAVRDELRWAGRQLGSARNLDVLVAHLQRMKHEEVRSHRIRAEQARTESYDALLETLSSPRFMRAILRAAAWIETGQWLTAGRKKRQRRSIRDHAALELPRRWKSIRKRSKRLAEQDPDQRHRLRIKVKNLRYMSEFLQGLFAQKPARRRYRWWLARLKRLQDTLGEMNDIAVGSELLPALAQTNPKQARKRERKLLSMAEDTARALRTADPFWT